MPSLVNNMGESVYFIMGKPVEKIFPRFGVHQIMVPEVVNVFNID